MTHSQKGIRRLDVSALSEVDKSTSRPVISVVRFDGNKTINSIPSILILAQQFIRHGGGSEDVYASRIQLHCTLEVAHRIRPTVLATVDVSTPFKDSRVVGQRADGDGELVTGVVVIKIAVVKVRSQGKVRLARIRFQSEGGIDCGFRQLQATRRVIEAFKVELIVCLSQPAICEKKNGVRAIA